MSLNIVIDKITTKVDESVRKLTLDIDKRVVHGYAGR
jgi:hypothetical protein